MQWEEIPVVGVHRDTDDPQQAWDGKETLGTEVNRGIPSRHRLGGDNWDSGKQGDTPSPTDLGWEETSGAQVQGETHSVDLGWEPQDSSQHVV